MGKVRKSQNYKHTQRTLQSDLYRNFLNEHFICASKIVIISRSRLAQMVEYLLSKILPLTDQHSSQHVHQEFFAGKQVLGLCSQTSSKKCKIYKGRLEIPYDIRYGKNQSIIIFFNCLL